VFQADGVRRGHYSICKRSHRVGTFNSSIPAPAGGDRLSLVHHGRPVRTRWGSVKHRPAPPASRPPGAHHSGMHRGSGRVRRPVP